MIILMMILLFLWITFCIKYLKDIETVFRILIGLLTYSAFVWMIFNTLKDFGL